MVKLLLQRKKHKRGTHGLIISPPLLTSASTLILADQVEARRPTAAAPTPKSAPAPSPPSPSYCRPLTPAAPPRTKTPQKTTSPTQFTPGTPTSEPLEMDTDGRGPHNRGPPGMSGMSGTSLNLHCDPLKTPRTPTTRHVSRTPQTPTRKRSSSSFTSTSGYSPQCFKYKAGEGGVEVALGGLRSSIKGGHHHGVSEAAVIARTRALAAITGTPPPPLPHLPPMPPPPTPRSGTARRLHREPSVQMVSRWSVSTADDSSSDDDEEDGDEGAVDRGALFYSSAAAAGAAGRRPGIATPTDNGGPPPPSFAASVKSLSLSIKSSKSTARSIKSFKSVARSIKSLRMPFRTSQSQNLSESEVQVPVAAHGSTCGATKTRHEQKQSVVPPLPLRPSGPRTDHEATDTCGPAAPATPADPPATPVTPGATSRSMGGMVDSLLRRLTPRKKNRRAWFIPAGANNNPMPDPTPGRAVISASPDFDDSESFRSWSSDPLDPACRTVAHPVRAGANNSGYSDGDESNFATRLGTSAAESKERSTSTGASRLKKTCELSTSSPLSVYSIAHLSRSSTRSPMPRPTSTFSLRRHSSLSGGGGEGSQAKMTLPAPIRIGRDDHENNLDAFLPTASPTSSLASPRRSFSSPFGSRPSSIALGLSSSLGAAPLGHDASLPPTPMSPFHDASREAGTAPLDRGGATSNAPSRPNTPSAPGFNVLTKRPHGPLHPSLIAPTDMHGYEGCVPHPHSHQLHQPLPKRGRDQSHRHSALPTAVDMLWPAHSKPSGSTPPMSPAQRSLSPDSESCRSRDRSPSGFSLLHRVPTNKTLRKVKSRASKLSFSAPFLHSHTHEHHVPDVPPLPRVLSRPATPVSTAASSVPSSASVVMVPSPFAPPARPAPVRSNASFRGALSDDDEPLTMDGVLSIVEWGASVSRPSSVGGGNSPGRDSLSLVDIITKEDDDEKSEACSFSAQQDTVSNRASTLSSSGPSAPYKSSIADTNSSAGSFESFDDEEDKDVPATAVPTIHSSEDEPRSLPEVTATMTPPRQSETSNTTTPTTLSDVIRDRTRRLSTPAGWRTRSPDASFGATPIVTPPPLPHKAHHHTESRKSRLFSLLHRTKTSLDPASFIDSPASPHSSWVRSPAGSDAGSDYSRSATPQNNAEDLGIGVPIDPFQSRSSTPTARVSEPPSPEMGPCDSPTVFLPPHLARTTKSYTSLPRCDSDATLDCATPVACDTQDEAAEPTKGVYTHTRANGSVHTFGQPSLRSLPSVESLTLVDSHSESEACVEDEEEEERLSGELALEALLDSQEVLFGRPVGVAA